MFLYLEQNMNDHNIAALSELFVALSDQTRLKLLSLIGDGEVPVGYLADALDISQPKVSRHLAYLRNAGLVSTRREGKNVYYGIETPDEEYLQQVLLETLKALGDRSIQLGRSPAAAQAESQRTEYVPQELPIYLL